MSSSSYVYLKHIALLYKKAICDWLVIVQSWKTKSGMVQIWAQENLFEMVWILAKRASFAPIFFTTIYCQKFVVLTEMLAVKHLLTTKTYNQLDKS